MIHLVNHRNRSLYHSQLISLHRARRAVFVDELGWKLPVRDGQEFDEYDDVRAQNVIGFSTEGDVVMGIRFRPTDDRAMLTDHFSEWLPPDIRPINDSRTWELSRGFCTERGMRRHNLRRKAACMIAPLEIALAHGIDRCVGFSDVQMLNFFYGVGWRLTVLGEPRAYAEGVGVAYSVEVSAEAVAGMRRMWGLPNPAWVMIDSVDPGENVHAMALRKLAARPDLAKLLPQPEPAPAEDTDGRTRQPGYYDHFESALR